MLLELVEEECEFDVVKNICSMLSSVYHNALEEATDFSWDTVPEFDKAHYKKLYHIIYDGAYPVKNIPITDDVLKNELWDFAKYYVILDTDNKLAYSYLVGRNRFPEVITSEKTKNALGLHVGDLNGVKLQENFLSKSQINFGRIPEVVRTRMFNDSKNKIFCNGKTYELCDRYGVPILYAKPAKTFFTRRDTVQLKYPRGGVNIFGDPSVEERKLILAKLAERYKAKSK